MTPRISEVPGRFLRETIVSEKDFMDIIELLLAKGRKIISAIAANENYSSLDDFLAKSDSSDTSLVKLEGHSERKNNLFILQKCPMAAVLDAAKVDGKLPDHFQVFVRDYKEMNPDNACIFHPGCVIHQFIRQQLISNIRINGNYCLNYFQLGCGSKATGKMVYDNYGMTRCGVNEQDIDRLMDKGGDIKACIYAVEKKD